MIRLVTARWLDLAPRVGFVALLALLVGFAALFMREADTAHAALTTDRSAREAKMTAQVDEALLRALAVAEARLEALEVLPLGDDDGLGLTRDGVQWLPRLPGAALETAAGARAEVLATLERGDGPASVRLLAAWPWLTRDEAAAWCVRAQREDVSASQLATVCARGLASERVDLSFATETPTLRAPWFAVRRGSEVHAVEVSMADIISRFSDAEETWTTTPPLHVSSPRFDAQHAEVRRALVLKLALLAVTALLGVSVVALSRLALRRREESIAAQRDFIATVSHELRTPLATVRLLAETLERKLPPDGPAKDYPRRLVAASDGLTFLVENILSFNRLEAGRWTPRREAFSLTSLEAAVRDDCALFVDVDVSLSFTGLETMAPHHLDAELLRIALLNLTRNALKYTTRRPVQLSLSGHDEGDVAVLRVRDNGPGIAAEERERVFEAFHRVSAKRGSGLGLAVARRIAALHRGTLRITASSDEGTTFELRLPRY